MVVVKKEPGAASKSRVKVKAEAAKTGFARGQIEHYRFQVALINSVVPQPWTVCFGALGTGIIGVRPGEGKSSSSSSKGPAVKVKKEKLEAGEEPAEEPAAAAAGEEGGSRQLPEDATVILLVNSRSFGLQSKGGKILGNYSGDMLDVERAQLRWSSQHRDRKNEILNAIVGHVERGGRVMVGVRGNKDPGQAQDGRDFRILGQVSHATDIVKFKFLVEDGETVVQERGSSLHHKHIKASCLDVGLKSGIGLSPKLYRKGRFIGKWCLKCAYEPGSCVFHFKELNSEGVSVFVKREAEDEEKAPVKRELPSDQPPTERPAKRIRKKVPACMVPVKRELAEGEVPAVAVKAEPLDEAPATAVATTPAPALPDPAPLAAEGEGEAEAPSGGESKFKSILNLLGAKASGKDLEAGRPTSKRWIALQGDDSTIEL